MTNSPEPTTSERAMEHELTVDSDRLSVEISPEEAATDEPVIVPVPIVAVGASAGGLEALEQFFSNVAKDSGVAYVVIQHLSSDHKSMMGELLSRHARIPVRTVTDNTYPAPDTVWLIPPGQELEIREGMLRLHDRPPGFRLPIDCFLESAAREQGEHCVAVILSGTGSDGSRGLRTIKEAGGFVLAQDPSTARFAGMPENAIATGLADIILPPERMPGQITKLLKGAPLEHILGIGDDSSPEAAKRGYHRIFELLKMSCGVDFSVYKPTTISRRVSRRMTISHSGSLEEYVDHLTHNATEREALFHELLIGVTRFFRDEELFLGLQRQVLAELIANAEFNQTLRIWIPGCSTGEEAYTMGMLLLEECEAQGRSVDIKIFASDIDQRALDVAARGVYPETAIGELTPERASRFFRPAQGGLQVVPALRSMVLFARHDVTRDPPFTRLDLISCRNLLIYLAPVQQQKLFTAFHVALRDGGGLFLGPSETAGCDTEHWRRASSDLPYFVPNAVDLRPNLMKESGYGLAPLASRQALHSQQPVKNSPMVRAAAALVQGAGLAAVLVDEDFKILHVFGAAGGYLQMPDGSPVLNILHLTAQPLSAILASGVPRVLRSGTAITYRDVRAGENDQSVQLRLLPSPESGAQAEVLVVFEEHHDVAAVADSAEEVQFQPGSEVYLSDLQVELQYAREGHQALVEELASSNEELQAANEELMASNEELQATNEELQSVNEELHTLNNEYQRKIQQLEELSADLDSLFEATDIGTLFLDSDLAIRRFTPSMCSLLPLMTHDIGRSVTHFSGALGRGFLDELQAVLEHGDTREKTFQLKSVPMLVRIMRVQLKASHGLVVTFVDVSVVERAYDVTRRVLNAIPAQVALIDVEGVIRLTNSAWDRFAIENGGDPTMMGVGINYLSVCGRNEEGADAAEGILAVLDGRADKYVIEYPCHSVTETRWFLMDVKPSEDGGAVITHFDVTERKLAELRLQGLATTDPLTAVLNRRGLEDVLSREMDQVRRVGMPLSVLMIDCDDFKAVNDRLGHAAGDVVLCSIVTTLKAELRSQDTLARVGGDEFMVLLPETGVAEARRLAERLRLAVSAQPVAISDEYMNLSVSMAIAQADLEVQRAQDLLERSREALSTSKRRGKNRVTLAATTFEDIRDVSGSRHMLQQMLDDDGALKAVAQPIVDISSREITSVELLTRSVYHPDVFPTTYFRAAVEEDLLTALDHRCFGHCLQACSDLPEDLSYSINLYPSTLLNLPVESLPNILGAAGGRKIVLEVSEQQIIGDPAYLLNHVDALRAVGVEIAIDDVGFGRTSLEALIVLEPEVVKIDRAYIKGVTNSGSRRRWLERLVQTSQALGARIVGEGVETASELHFLADLGVTAVQGFYFTPALPPDQIAPLVGLPLTPGLR